MDVIKKANVIFIILFCCFHFAVCSEADVQQNIQNQLNDYVQQAQDEYSHVQETESGQEQETQQSTESSVETESETLSDIYYAYHTLDKEEQRLYLEIWHALADMKTDAKVSTLDTEQLNRVFQYVLADHPELFYVEGYQYTKYTTAGVLTELTFTGSYSMSRDMMQQTARQIDDAVNNMTAPLEQITDQYTIVRYLYDALITSTEYDSNAANNQNIQSVFLQGRSVCQGYAKAMQYLLQKKGIQAVLVTGYTNGEGHAWNLVRVNNAYYYLDPTWGDASYSQADDGTGQVGPIPAINYDYFLVTTQELFKTHQLDDNMPVPQCTAVEDNYYVHEGLYLNSYNEDMIKMIFQNAIMNGSSYITMKCCDAQVYSEVQNRLIEEQEVFRFLGSEGGSIAYTVNPTQLTISFWL